MKSLFDSSSTALLELCALPIPTGFSSFASASGDNSFGVFEDAIELFEGKTGGCSGGGVGGTAGRG